MAHNGKHTYARIRINQEGRSNQRSLKKGDRITIGISPENDIVILGEKLPKKSVLLERRNSECLLHLRSGMEGKIWVGDSSLSFNDLIAHNILPKKGNSSILTIPLGRKGIVKIGDAQVEFVFESSASKPADDLPGYGWIRATSQASGRDLLFKLMLTLFISLEVVFHFSIKDIIIKEPEHTDISKVPERFARFVVKAPTPEVVETPTGTTGTNAANADGEKKTDETQTRKRTTPQKGSGGGEEDKPIQMKGVLGLIAGVGESQQSGNAVGFLIDQGMVKELDEMLGTSSLKTGKGKGSGTGSGIGDGTGDLFDDIMAVGTAGGIDDLISDVDGVETVDMSKKSRVEIQQPSKMTGSQEALGQRNPESIRAIINSQQGRIQYTFNKYLRKNPNLRGKISLDVTIKADGTVERVTMVESTVAEPDFAREIMNIIRRLKFPRIPEGDVTVNLPFVFQRID